MQSFTVIDKDDTLMDSLGYINDNFKSLKSSFAGEDYPENPVAGQKYFDGANGILSIYDGTSWIVIPTVTDKMQIPGGKIWLS